MVVIVNIVVSCFIKLQKVTCFSCFQHFIIINIATSCVMKLYKQYVFVGLKVLLNIEDDAPPRGRVL